MPGDKDFRETRENNQQNRLNVLPPILQQEYESYISYTNLTDKNLNFDTAKAQILNCMEEAFELVNELKTQEALDLLEQERLAKRRASYPKESYMKGGENAGKDISLADMYIFKAAKKYLDSKK